MTPPSKDYERGTVYTKSPLKWTGKESHQWLRPETQPATTHKEGHYDLGLYFLRGFEIMVPGGCFPTFSF